MLLRTYNPKLLSLPIINIHQHPLTNVPTNYQLLTPYSFRDIARIRFYRSKSLQQGQSHYSKVKGTIKVTPCRCTPKPPNQYPY